VLRMTCSNNNSECSKCLWASLIPLAFRPLQHLSLIQLNPILQESTLHNCLLQAMPASLLLVIKAFLQLKVSLQLVILKAYLQLVILKASLRLVILKAFLQFKVSLRLVILLPLRLKELLLILVLILLSKAFLRLALSPRILVSLQYTQHLPLPMLPTLLPAHILPSSNQQLM